MSSAMAAWQGMRVLRWLLWAALLGFSLYIFANRATVVTSFGQLPIGVEVTIYALGVAAVFAGMFEMMLREMAGVKRR